MRIDLNADLGESPERWASGEDRLLLDVVTSANVCCGAYAGSEALMRVTCETAVARGVAIGAQVGYPDREGFGRRFRAMASTDLTNEILDQVLLLDEIAASVGGAVTYIKPHGALYNTIVDDTVQAQAVVDAMRQLAVARPLMGLTRSVSLAIAESCGILVLREGFADRAYTPDGRLVDRREPGAVLNDPAASAAQAVRLAATVDSICVHSDSPGALATTRAVRAALEASGAQVQSLAT